MALLVLGVCVAVGLGLAGYWLLNTEPAKIRTALKWFLIIGAAVGVIALIARGNPSYLWSAGVFLIPLFLRWRRISQYFKNAAKTAAGPSPGQSSSVRTGFLEMNLDHDTGDMSGIVRDGRHAGRELADMSLEDLLDLLGECQSDPQSVQLLESFIDRAHGDDWRFTDYHTNRNSESRAAPGGPMSRAQALEILGVEDGASTQEIRDAHRRLMLANHPDRGGSTFLAAQINQAKEVLLGTG
ncbi:MAG: DnaJ domain-containing protein [Alphaproteobacteria bacterium]|jgi:hypothetical protein|nr:DnaJ domain-containing protein [Alphaproteobacteria bacterium]